MDIASALGILGGAGVVVVLILIDGGNFGQYFDKHAVIVIFGGATMATMLRYSFAAVMHGLPMGMKWAFKLRGMSHRDLVEEISRIAEINRRNGPTALESVETNDPFLAQGLRYLADGYDVDFIKDAMSRDRDNIYTQLDESQKIYRSIGDCAPAFGMIGTLLGMVNMFANMTDPSKLGPYMAVALLATLYGAVVANMICMPIADKLHGRMVEEDIARAIVIDGIVEMRKSKSPQVIRELLVNYLTDHDREHLAEAA